MDWTRIRSLGLVVSAGMAMCLPTPWQGVLAEDAASGGSDTPVVEAAQASSDSNTAGTETLHEPTPAGPRPSTASPIPTDAQPGALGASGSSGDEPAELDPTPAEPARAAVLSEANEPATVPEAPMVTEPAETSAPVEDKDSVVEVVPRRVGEEGSEEEGHLEPIPDPMQAEPPAVEAASFNGVTPGVTTIEQVAQAWGSPQEIAKQGEILVHWYRVDPFDRVEVSYFQGKAISLVIRLQQAFPADAVAQQLELTNIRPVLVANALGEILGQSFPERGVLFAFEPSKEPGKATMNVTQIILEPISAEPFVLRAETNLETFYKLSLADLDQALKLDPLNDRTHWLRARVLSAMGNQSHALEAAAKAVELAPSNPRYHITYGQALGYLGRHEEAIQEVEKAIQLGEKWGHVKARALCLMGDLLSSGPRRDYKQAIQFHIEAVKTADPLTADKHPAIRVAAKEVLIDAHLGAANDVAWGHWKEKEQAINKWLQGAVAVTEDLIANDRGSDSLRFRVASRALAAHVGAQGSLDPSDWTEKSLALGRTLVESAHDEAKKQQHCWDLGMALYDALQVYQMRKEHDLALRYGELAIDYLEQVGEEELQSPASRYLLGRLYFRLGAIHAIADENHRAAIAWFDKAVPLLVAELPAEAQRDLGRHGETFVSMGVSYWETGQRDKAVELTERGVNLMEQAVQNGVLEENALSVPYGNLAIMHQQLGQEASAKKFSEMAARHQDTKQR